MPNIELFASPERLTQQLRRLIIDEKRLSDALVDSLASEVNS
jgi:hypothetical protein